MGIGVAAGVAAGAVIGAMTYEECEPQGGIFDCLLASDSREEEMAWGGAAIGVVGLALGTVVGLVRRVERWEPLALPFKAAVQPTGTGGIGLRVSMEF